MSTCAYVFLGITCAYELTCCSLFGHSLYKECKGKNNYKIIQQTMNNNDEDSQEFDQMLKKIDNIGEEKETPILWTNKPLLSKNDEEEIEEPVKYKYEKVNFNVRSSLETLYEDQSKEEDSIEL
tara:strand:- start:113 stop:484 length:372 start_codon:yes stop_codon:yes gene_type:complete